MCRGAEISFWQRQDWLELLASEQATRCGGRGVVGVANDSKHWRRRRGGGSAGAGCKQLSHLVWVGGRSPEMKREWK